MPRNKALTPALFTILGLAGCGAEGSGGEGTETQDVDDTPDAPGGMPSDGAPTGTGPGVTPPAAPGPVTPAGSPDDMLLPEEMPGAVPTSTGPVPTEACVSDNTSAELEPVILAFAFDVSGSMGQGDFPYHDRSLKWDPVVSATKTFFNDPASQGLSASLVFFPVEDDKCESDSYATPVVPLTALPSIAFSNAIDANTPATEDDWIGGTPTLAVLQGTHGFLQQSIQDNPEARHAIVLVTDGYPQGCDDEVNDIEAVAAFVGSYSDLLPTYVIGVKNPITEEEPDPPDVVTNLNLIAENGGTETAFVIDTGDATQTSADFAAVVEAIRGNSLSCTLVIPPPPSGETLDTELVNVTFTGSAGAVALAYSADCSLENSWHFDDPAAPTTIELCETTCSTVLDDTSANLDVEFGCVRRTTPQVAR